MRRLSGWYGEWTAFDAQLHSLEDGEIKLWISAVGSQYLPVHLQYSIATVREMASALITNWDLSDRQLNNTFPWLQAEGVAKFWVFWGEGIWWTGWLDEHRRKTHTTFKIKQHGPIAHNLMWRPSKQDIEELVITVPEVKQTPYQSCNSCCSILKDLKMLLIKLKQRRGWYWWVFKHRFRMNLCRNYFKHYAAEQIDHILPSTISLWNKATLVGHGSELATRIILWPRGTHSKRKGFDPVNW